MKTFLEICQYIGNLPNSELDDNINTLSDVEDEQINAINAANRIVWNSEKWQFREDNTTFDTVAGQKYYDWIGHIEKDGVQIAGSILAYQEKLRNETEASGTPTKYGKEKSYLRLYPTPNSIQTVSVWHSSDYPVRASDDSLKRMFDADTSDDVLNVPEYLEDIYIDCVAFLANEILNADQTDEEYLEHKFRREEFYKLLKDADNGTQDNTTGFVI